MLTVISDMKGVLAVLGERGPVDVPTLQREYDAILDPGPNPWCHEEDKPRQEAWVERVRQREQFLTLKYGGTADDDGTTVYSPLTFANWLVREKGFVFYAFTECCLTQFD